MVKKHIVLIATLLCCAALLAGGTLAYFSAEETAYNVITTGSLAMALREEAAGGMPFPEGGIHGMMPGETSPLKVYVENTGAVDFYARVAFEASILPETLSTEYLAFDINTADWTLKSGWYYYNAVVPPGGKTAPLFTQLSFGGGMDNPYMDAGVNVDVAAQAVQSKNNGASALTALGWPTV